MSDNDSLSNEELEQMMSGGEQPLGKIRKLNKDNLQKLQESRDMMLQAMLAHFVRETGGLPYDQIKLVQELSPDGKSISLYYARR